MFTHFGKVSIKDTEDYVGNITQAVGGIFKVKEFHLKNCIVE